MEERLRTLNERVKSRNILERVIKKLDLDQAAQNDGQYEGLINNIRNGLNIDIKRQGRRGEMDFFIISYRGRDPKTVRDLVNTLVSEYIEESLGAKRKDAFGAYEFIDKQLLEYKKRLEQSDRAIRVFRERNPYMVPQSETAILQRIEDFQSSRIEAEIILKELLRKRDNLQQQLSGEKELTVAFVTRENSPQARLNYLQNQLMVLMAKYTENYPEVIKVKSEIEELKRRITETEDLDSDTLESETAGINPIYQQLKEELATTGAESEAVKARVGELMKQQQVAQGILGRMPKEQEEWTKLQRDRNVYQKIYDDLLEKLENARVSKDLEHTAKTASFRVVDPAVFPLMPISPNIVIIILIGLILCVGAAVGVVYGLENLVYTYKDEESIENRLKLPVLTTIPKIVSEVDNIFTKKLDRKVFSAAGIYLFVIILVLAKEFLYRYMGIRIINF
jgi:polysaccharide chain length determinant protein (PEP-CTERM system associated)